MNLIKIIGLSVLVFLIVVGVYEFKKHQGKKIEKAIHLLHSCPPDSIITVTSDTGYFTSGLSVVCNYANKVEIKINES